MHLKKVAVVMAMMVFPSFAYAQGRFSVLFDGTVLSGQSRFFGKTLVGDIDLNQFKAGKAVFPGVEVRFNQKGRVTLGVSYQRWELKRDPVRVFLPGFKLGKIIPGIMSWDSSAEAKGDVAFATIYVNILTHGKLRPFVGVGSGIGRFQTLDYQRNIFQDPDFFPEPEDLVSEGVKEAAQAKPMVKGIAGLNIFPVKHLVISVGGGYFNGGVFNFGAGVTF